MFEDMVGKRCDVYFLWVNEFFIVDGIDFLGLWGAGEVVGSLDVKDGCIMSN